MYAALISHSSDLQRLQAEGFVMEVCDGWLIIHHIPYVNAAREMKDGTLLMPLSISGDHTIRPNNHTANCVGEQACDIKGKPLPSLVNTSGQQVSVKGVRSNFFFSCHAEKEEFPPNGDYPDYYEKVKHYFDTIAAPALYLDPDAWNLINKPLHTVAEDSPLRYMDTNSSRAKITGLSNKFKGLKIGIIGLGGTGSYLLDLIAKTPVAEIHLFDADVINTHNAFRAPGAMSETDLSKAPKKVDYYAQIYSNMHKGIKPQAVMVTSDNFADLDTLDYVFLSLDVVSAKKQIAGYLIDKHIPFIDSGMGINQNPDGKLSGMLHVAIGTPDHYQHLSQVMGSENAEKDEYATDIQIAELNALAANLSVIQWKKMLGFYADISHEVCSVYTINCNDIDHYEDKET